MEKGKRIELLDAVRGFSVGLMVIHHFLYDLYHFCGAPKWLYINPVFNVLHYFFAGLFIFISGISSDFSHSNLRRGAKAMLAALGITLVTSLIDSTVVFGALHLLAACMLLYGVSRPLWDRLPRPAVFAFSVLGILLTARMAVGITVETPHLWIFGLTTADFASSDYFPLFPWSFVFLLGTWAGHDIREGRLPRWFYTARAPHFALIGRHALIIYILHQPVLFALTMAGRWLFASLGGV